MLFYFAVNVKFQTRIACIRLITVLNVKESDSDLHVRYTVPFSSLAQYQQTKIELGLLIAYVLLEVSEMRTCLLGACNLAYLSVTYFCMSTIT